MCVHNEQYVLLTRNPATAGITNRPLLDPSAAEFRRRRQPAPCRAAAAGKNSARRHASRNLLKPPPPPQFLRRAAAQVILTNCDTCSSFIMKLSNSLFCCKICCNVVKPPARLHVKSAMCFETHTPCLILRRENPTYTYWRRAARASRGSKMVLFTAPWEDLCRR